MNYNLVIALPTGGVTYVSAVPSKGQSASVKATQSSFAMRL